MCSSSKAFSSSERARSMRHWLRAIWSRRKCSVSVEGSHSSSSRARMDLNSSRSVPARDLEQRLYLTALREEVALPDSVRGPVAALADLAESAVVLVVWVSVLGMVRHVERSRGAAATIGPEQ